MSALPTSSALPPGASPARPEARFETLTPARLDAVLVVAATAGGAWLGQASAGAGAGGESLMGATAALGLGILFYVVRRDRDLSRFAAQARWRERAVEGKGVTLSDWKDGAALEPWPRRRPAEPGRPG